MILTVNELKQAFNLSDYPVSISANGTKATVTISNHNFKTGDYITVDETDTDLDGIKLVTRLNANTLEYKTTYTGTKEAVIKQHDAQLERIISQTENFITNYCDLQFGNTAEASEVYDLQTSGIIYPKRGLLEESDVKTIRLSRVNNFTDSTKYIELSSEDIFVYENRIELKFEKVYEYLNCKKAVKLTYTTQTCPDGLKYIAMQIAEYHWRNLNDKNINETSRSLNGDQRVFAKSLPQQIFEDLEKYRRITIGEAF